MSLIARLTSRSRPTQLAGRPLPRELQGFRLWLCSPPEVLARVRDLLGEPEPRADDPVDSAGDATNAAAAPSSNGDVAAQRDALVEAIIEARDVVSHDGAAAMLGRALASVGVQTLDPVGQRFDPERHDWLVSVPAERPGQEGEIAQTIRLGYEDSGRLRRVAGVAVYDKESR